MKITVITPTFNCEDKVSISIQSVLKQNNSKLDYEYIIMDGQSSDGTIDVVKQFMGQSDKIILFSEKDNGIYDAMNKAVTHASGDYIIFLGAGDYLMDNIFDAIEKALQSDNPDILYGYVMTRRGDKEEALVRYADKKYTYRILPVCHQAILAKRELFLEKTFDVAFKAVADQDWIMYMLKHKKSFMYIPEAIAFYEEDGFSSNPNTVKQCRMDLNTIHKRYFPFRRLFYKATHFWKKQQF